MNLKIPIGKYKNENLIKSGSSEGVLKELSLNRSICKLRIVRESVQAENYNLKFSFITSDLCVIKPK